MNKIKCFPRPIAVHFLENNSPDMNIHLLNRSLQRENNINLTIASKLYKIEIYKLCYNPTSHKAYYSVFSDFDRELKAEQFVIVHFDDCHKGGEHYSALENIEGGNERPVLQVTDSVQSWRCLMGLASGPGLEQNLK